MTQEKINIISRQRRLFRVAFCYTDGEYDYTEILFYRASRQQLEAEISQLIGEFADEDTEITWTFENQDVTKEESRYRRLSALSRGQCPGNQWSG